MRLIIDIPEELYKSIPKDKSDIGYMDMSDWQKIINIVKNGTPLFEGHGRLIDADETIANADEVYSAGTPSIITADQMYAIRKALTVAPTIIEADKEGE